MTTKSDLTQHPPVQHPPVQHPPAQHPPTQRPAAQPPLAGPPPTAGPNDALATTSPRRNTPAEDDAAFLHALGHRVRLSRTRRGMTRRILAAQSGVSERYISAVEAGTGNPSILLLRALAQALNVPLDTLLRDAPDPPIPPTPRRPDYRGRIALIGLRGAGKSTLGRLLAERRRVSFLELDREIEKEAGLNLAEIMELHGQAGFRRLERSVLDRLIEAHPEAVIAAGGGIVAETATFVRLLECCLTIWVTASPESHMQRVIDQGDLRPMRDNRRSMADLRAILASREALYARADLRIDTTGRTVEATIATLLANIASPTVPDPTGPNPTGPNPTGPNPTGP